METPDECVEGEAPMGGNGLGDKHRRSELDVEPDFPNRLRRGSSISGDRSFSFPRFFFCGEKGLKAANGAVGSTRHDLESTAALGSLRRVDFGGVVGRGDILSLSFWTILEFVATLQSRLYNLYLFAKWMVRRCRERQIELHTYRVLPDVVHGSSASVVFLETSFPSFDLSANYG
jgi:hypothetical protein